MQYTIPRRIVQFWSGSRFRPSLRTQALNATIRLHNPDFDYIFLDGPEVNDFVAREFPQYQDVLRGFPHPAQRNDFIKYLALLRFGGFYFDSDVLMAASLSPLLDYGCVFPFETISLSFHMRRNLGVDWQAGTFAFGAAPGHPFIQKVIDNCVRGQREPQFVEMMMPGCPPFIRDEYYVINSTGPALVSRTLAEERELAGMVAVVFPDDVCDKRTWGQFGQYAIHMADGTWRTRKNFFMRRVAGYCWWAIERRRVAESRTLGKTRTHPAQSPDSRITAHTLGVGESL